MVEIIYNDRMSISWPSPRLFFQRLEIAAVVFVIDFIIKRHKVRTFFCDIEIAIIQQFVVLAFYMPLIRIGIESTYIEKETAAIICGLGSSR